MYIRNNFEMDFKIKCIRYQTKIDVNVQHKQNAFPFITVFMGN